MKYNIYIVYDNCEEYTTAISAKERDKKIKKYIKAGDCVEIGYCPIYQDGEYGIFKKAYEKEDKK